MNRRSRSNIMLVLTAFIWGVAFVAQSVGMDYVGPYTFNGARFLIGGLVLIPCIFGFRYFNGTGRTMTRAAAARKRNTGIIGGICCGICLCIASALQQIGIAQTTVGKGRIYYDSLHSDYSRAKYCPGKKSRIKGVGQCGHSSGRHVFAQY